MQTTDKPTDRPNMEGLVLPSLLRELSAESLEALADGGVPSDPAQLTARVAHILLALADYAVEYGGEVTITSPYLTIRPLDFGPTPRWRERLDQRMSLMAGLDLSGSDRAEVDGWIVSVGGAA